MQQEGKKTPLDDQPEIDAYDQWFLQAFNRLANGRQVGMDYCPLVVSEITKYWKDVERIGELIEFIDIMQALDRAFLEYRADQREQQTAANQSQSMRKH